MRSRTKINEQGRLVIPAECRAAAGLAPGDELTVEVVAEGEVRLVTKSRAIREAQELYARHVPADRDLVSQLIAERREDSKRENE